MKKTLFVIIASILVAGCAQKNDNQPLTGSKWGELRNGSAEDVVSSKVEYWEPGDVRSNMATHFYDFDAKDGNKSLTIFSNTPAMGEWNNKVNLKPFAKYRFTGWVKTENLECEGKGAGIIIKGMDVDPAGFKGTNDWQPVEYIFETGANDAAIVSCALCVNEKTKATGRAWFDDMKFEFISEENIKTAVTIDVDKTAEPMSEYVYGQFIEHLGKCIYGGIWAEMIKDRKFYFKPGDRESEWKVGGNLNQLSVDRINSYTGELTPVLNLSPGKEISIMQDELGLIEGMEYTGHIVLKTAGSVKNVKISLSAEDYTESVIIDSFSPGYNDYPISFNSEVFTHNAKIEISAQGQGKVYIGTLSLMPADNIDGLRKDVITLLKELNSPVYRWPGGNFVSGYNWRDGIGPRDKRPPRKNPAWSGIEHNDVGMHEFIQFCRILNTEPYIAVNAGLGNVEEARQQVEYCNGSTDTPMGRLRARNGDTEPWKVKWWSIGNEMYGSWQLGFMSTEEYVKKHNSFAEAMRSVDPEVKLIAVGDVGDWDEMILSNCADNMDLISEHFYYQDWHGGGLMTHVLQIPRATKAKADAHRKYREEIPGLAGKDIRICLDEYNYWYGPHIYGELGTRYFMRDAMGIAAGMNEFCRQSDMIYMANYAQTVNVIGCIKTNTTHSVMAATGQVLKLYRAEYGTIPVSVEGETRPVDIAATLSPEGDMVVISVINPTWGKVNIDIDIVNTSVGKVAEHWSITAPDDMAYNEPGKPEKVIINSPESISFINSVEVDPVSINIFRIPVEK